MTPKIARGLALHGRDAFLLRARIWVTAASVILGWLYFDAFVRLTRSSEAWLCVMVPLTALASLALPRRVFDPNRDGDSIGWTGVFTVLHAALWGYLNTLACGAIWGAFQVDLVEVPMTLVILCILGIPFGVATGLAFGVVLIGPLLFIWKRSEDLHVGAYDRAGLVVSAAIATLTMAVIVVRLAFGGGDSLWALSILSTALAAAFLLDALRLVAGRRRLISRLRGGPLSGLRIEPVAVSAAPSPEIIRLPYVIAREAETRELITYGIDDGAYRERVRTPVVRLEPRRPVSF